MYRVRLCRVLLDPTLRVINVKHLSLNSSKPIQSARFFSTTKLVRSVDPDSLQFENASSIVSNGAEPTLFSQGLGLANHYPSGYMQNMLEQVHLNFDLPWWAAIVTTTIVMRGVIFPLFVKARKLSIISCNHAPEMAKFQDEIMTSTTPEEMEINQKNYKKYKEEHNINEFAPLLPMMGTAPVFASMFFGLRGMANLPVESLQTGGTLWFTNLAATDPIFLLPILTCTSLLVNVKVGGDGADTLPPAIKKMLYVLPIVALPVMCQFPAALNVYWFTNNLISIAQVRLLSLSYVKNVFGFATQRKGITMEGPIERMQTREAMRIRKLKEKKEKENAENSTKASKES